MLHFHSFSAFTLRLCGFSHFSLNWLLAASHDACLLLPAMPFGPHTCDCACERNRFMASWRACCSPLVLGNTTQSSRASATKTASGGPQVPRSSSSSQSAGPQSVMAVHSAVIKLTRSHRVLALDAYP
eukprot:6084068-Amphidinium_carterae.2